MTSDHAGRFVALQRTAAALLGGYAFTWGFIALGMVLLFIALVVNIISQQIRQFFTPEGSYG